jgi:hypothetical protein
VLATVITCQIVYSLVIPDPASVQMLSVVRSQAVSMLYVTLYTVFFTLYTAQQSTGEDWTDVALTLTTAKPKPTATATAATGGATGNNSSSSGLPTALKKTIKLQKLKQEENSSSAAHAPNSSTFTFPSTVPPAGAAGAAVQASFVGPAEPDSKSGRRIVKRKAVPGRSTTTSSTTAAATAPSFSVGAQSTPNKPFGSALSFTAQPGDGINAGGFTFGGASTMEPGGFKFAAAPAPAPAAAAAAVAGTAVAGAVEEVEEVVVPTATGGGISGAAAVVYTIEGAATVLSGKGPQRVTVGVLQLDAEVAYHCVPSVDSAVYVKVSGCCWC